MSDLVSICIPVYNCERFIGEAIRSSLIQTYKNVEILVIDNCSTDNTLNVIKSFSDNRIKFLINDKNLGMVDNWNRCIREAKGDYIIILCADDKLKSNCIEKKMQMFNENKEVVLVSSATDIIDENDNIKFHRHNFNRTKVLDGNKLFYRSLRLYNVFGEPSNNIFKKSLAHKVGYFNNNLRYYPDWEFWLKLSLLGKVGYINEPLSEYRVSLSNATNSLMKEKEILKKEQNVFFDSLSHYANITNIDKNIHVVSQFFRSILRKIVMRIM